ncbi:MAG: hypothetical protein AAFX90_17800 [Pseudomonadota bacterium]
MMDTDILEMLDEIGRKSVARLSPVVVIAGDTPELRRTEVLRVIRNTILPRRLEFTAANGDCLALEVNSSRVTDVFRVVSGAVPDFETAPREELIDNLAQLVSDIALAPAPLELLSLKPDNVLEADDVGVTLREIRTACAAIELTAEPTISVVPEPQEPAPETPEIAPRTDANASLAQAFFDGADRFAQGRVLAAAQDGTLAQAAEECAPDAKLHPNQDLLTRFAADLAGWDKDTKTGLGLPQLIVMRPSGGKGAGLAVVNDGRNIAFAVHEARKLGAVVNLWTTLQEAEE